jgi:conjugal transfer pilus assembly protein TraE
MDTTMTLEYFKNEQFKVFLQNQKLTIALVASMVLNGVLTLYILVWATNERTIVLPPYNPTQEFWVAGDRVSSSYLDQIGRYIADVLWNVSINNAKHVKPAILPLVPSEYWRQVDLAITEQLSYITDNAITRLFHVSDVKWDIPNKLLVRGVLKEMSADIVTLTKSTTLLIDYKIQNGRFYLLGIAEENR